LVTTKTSFAVFRAIPGGRGVYKLKMVQINLYANDDFNILHNLTKKIHTQKSGFGAKLF
jgi:hypothetical protein